MLQTKRQTRQLNTLEKMEGVIPMVLNLWAVNPWDLKIIVIGPRINMLNKNNPGDEPHLNP